MYPSYYILREGIVLILIKDIRLWFYMLYWSYIFSTLCKYGWRSVGKTVLYLFAKSHRITDEEETPWKLDLQSYK